MRFVTSLRGALAFVVAAFVASLMFAPAASAAQQSSSATGVNSVCAQQVLAIGASGECVRQLQQGIIARGGTVGPHGADGSFGPDTQDGLLSIQSRNGLYEDGIAGNQVWTFLRSGQVVALGAAVAVPAPSTASAVVDSSLPMGKVAVADKSDGTLVLYENRQVVNSFPARFGGTYWDPVTEKIRRGTTPEGVFTTGYMQKDMVSSLFDVAMPDSVCFAGGALYCVHGSSAFDAYGYTSPFFEGAAGSAGCINLKTWDSPAFYEWVGRPGGATLIVR